MGGVKPYSGRDKSMKPGLVPWRWRQIMAFPLLMGRQAKAMSLSTYPEVGLRKARSLRDEARRLIAQGTNPCTHRRH